MAHPSAHIARGLWTYQVRIMAGIIIVELICIILIYFWPTRQTQPTFKNVKPVKTATNLKAPVTTVQGGAPPTAANPRVPPIPVPNDQPIKVKIRVNHPDLLTNNANLNAPPGLGGSGHGRGMGEGNGIVGNPEVSPRVTRIVEPSYKNNTDNKYQITVKFLVDKKGNVETAQIVAIYQLNKAGQPTKKLTNISPRIMDVVIRAAMNWKFIPAKDHGKPVKSYTKNYFII
jgi:hypothetical protein